MSMRRFRLLMVVVVVAAGLMVASLAWATLFTPTKVEVGKTDQLLPAATPGATYLAYSANTRAHPRHYDAYVKPSGQPRIKVNRDGEAWVGGISGDSLIYQHVRNGYSNIQLFDLDTHSRSV